MLRTTWRTLKTIASGFFENKPFQLAAALSYYTLLSMAPLLLLLTGLAGRRGAHHVVLAAQANTRVPDGQ